LSNAPDVHGRFFCELLQSVRANMAGIYRGRRRLSHRREERWPILRAQRQRRPGPARCHFNYPNIAGPEFTLRYNEYRSAQINGSAAPGYSSYQAMDALEETFRQTMPSEMGYDYLGLSFQEKKAQQGVSPTVV